MADGALFTLDPSQERAIDLLVREPFGIITGAPGTGKTTCLRAGLDRIADERPDDEVELAASTGKASKRLSDATGREARTVHRLLDYNPRYGFQRNADNPIDADLVVVDEASMLDVELSGALFDALDPKRTRLVLVGDMHQLPSVGPGRVFGDLIESGLVPVARLTTLHRAAQRSWVCRSAPVILDGQKPDLKRRDDFVFVDVGDAHTAARVAVGMVASVLPGRGIEGAMVLSPQNTGHAGVEALNAALQDRLNPPRMGESKFGSLRWSDRVIQTKNDYDRAIFNGEIGDVVSIDRGKVTVDFEGRRVDFDAEGAGRLRLAYALTVHRAQGSEYPWCVVICHSTHTRMLTRQLLYTAITRAKEGVVLVGDAKGLARALKNTRDVERKTSLIERLKAEGEGNA